MSAQPEQGRIEHKHATFYRDGEQIPVEDIEYTIDEEFERMIGDTEAGDLNEYYVKVYRTRDGKRHYLFRALPADFPISDRIRDTYGTGDYEVWMMRKNKIAARMSKAIEAPPDWKAPGASEAPASESAAIVASIGQLGELIVKVTESQRAAMTPVTAAVTAAPVDQTVMMQGMLGVLLQAKQLFGPGDNPPPNASESAMQAFIKGVEVAKDVSGAGGETNLLDVIVKMAEPGGVFGKLTELAEAQHNNLTNPPALVGPDGQPLQQVVTGPTSEPTPEQKQAHMQLILQKQLAFLLQQARAGKSPELYAEVVLDQWPTKLVVDFVAAPDAIEKLKLINPEVAQYENWFRTVGESITAMLSDEGKGELDTSTETEDDTLAPEPDTNGDTDGDTERPTRNTGNA